MGRPDQKVGQELPRRERGGAHTPRVCAQSLPSPAYASRAGAYTPVSWAQRHETSRRLGTRGRDGCTSGVLEHAPAAASRSLSGSRPCGTLTPARSAASSARPMPPRHPLTPGSSPRQPSVSMSIGGRPARPGPRTASGSASAVSSSPSPTNRHPPEPGRGVRRVSKSSRRPSMHGRDPRPPRSPRTRDEGEH